jgi:RNA polymerase sigma-70 factor (ECF subfamily)
MDWVYPHIDRLRRMLRRRGRSVDDTDDVMQDLFVRILSSCPSGESVRNPESFLARVALNLSTNAYEREHRELYVNEPVDALCLVDRSLAPDELATRDESLERLQSALDQLEERTSKAYLLHRLYGLTYEQIGEQLDMTVRNVENHIARAMHALAMEMQRK